MSAKISGSFKRNQAPATRFVFRYGLFIPSGCLYDSRSPWIWSAQRKGMESIDSSSLNFDLIRWISTIMPRAACIRAKYLTVYILGQPDKSTLKSVRSQPTTINSLEWLLETKLTNWKRKSCRMWFDMKHESACCLDGDRKANRLFLNLQFLYATRNEFHFVRWLRSVYVFRSHIFQRFRFLPLREHRLFVR